MRAYYRAKGGNLARKPESQRLRLAARRAEGWKIPWTPERKAASERRRAQKLGVDSEVFLHIEIFDRDGWICGLCGDPVPPEAQYPDRLSASLDHIVPLSLGGAHTRANSRCSHLTCNVARGNRDEGRLAGAPRAAGFSLTSPSLLG
jgi:5-methylcytosine-specific restriction endonuclease McrA